MLHLTKKLKRLFSNERGASATEFALVLPVIILMFVGLFESGYALWGYLTLVNGNREAARYSVRADVLDFEYTTTTDDIKYNDVIEHGITANSNQLKITEYANNTMEGEPKAAIIVTHLVVDTQKPCDGNDCYTEANGCAPDYTKDDLVLGPQSVGYEYLQYKYPENTPFTSRLDSADTLAELKAANDEFNCKLWRKQPAGMTPDWSKNSVIIVENFYEQPQLLGFPLIGMVLNPVPLYAQTTLRIESNDVGRCELLPIGMHEDTLIGWQALSSEARDIWNGSSSDDRGWLFWNAQDNNPNTTDLEEAMLVPRMATTDYVDPYDWKENGQIDDQINAGDWVGSTSGSHTGAGDVLDSLAGRTFMVPVWDTSDRFQNIDAYHIVQFALVKLTGDNELPQSGGGGHINALLVDPDYDGACPSNGM